MNKLYLIILAICIQASPLYAENLNSTYQEFIFKLGGPTNGPLDGLGPPLPFTAYVLEIKDEPNLTYPSVIWIHGSNNQVSKLEFAQKGKKYETYLGGSENERFVSILYKVTEGEAFFPFLASETKHIELPNKIYSFSYLFHSAGLNNNLIIKDKIDNLFERKGIFPLVFDGVTKESCGDFPTIFINSYQKNKTTLYHYSSSCVDWTDGHVIGKTYSTLLKLDDETFKVLWESRVKSESLYGSLMLDIDNDSNPETVIQYWDGAGVRELVEITEGKLDKIKTLLVSGD